MHFLKKPSFQICGVLWRSCSSYRTGKQLLNMAPALIRIKTQWWWTCRKRRRPSGSSRITCTVLVAFSRSTWPCHKTVAHICQECPQTLPTNNTLKKKGQGQDDQLRRSIGQLPWVNWMSCKAKRKCSGSLVKSPSQEADTLAEEAEAKWHIVLSEALYPSVSRLWFIRVSSLEWMTEDVIKWMRWKAFFWMTTSNWTDRILRRH